jgi:hypothetical protein
MTDRNEASQHQDDPHDGREVDRRPDGAVGDDAGDTLRIVDRRDWVNQISNHAEQCPNDGGHASEPQNPEVASSITGHVRTSTRCGALWSVWIERIF